MITNDSTNKNTNVNRRRRSPAASPEERRRDRAGRLGVAGIAIAVVGLLWALAHDRRLDAVPTTLLVLGGVVALAGLVLWVASWSWWVTRRRRRDRRQRRQDSGPVGSSSADPG